MTTDKQKWWQNWIVYALVGLLLMLVPYVGAYFLLGTYAQPIPDFGRNDFHCRAFKYDTQAKVFAPLGWAEAKIRGEDVLFVGPEPCSEIDFYEPGW
ncbi:hypothetical protein Pan258_57480 [Symmachiella dynata]|uniref:hypothetical protein n=1 Tax=Symmachiella dynata TaxID=2527995 RepID=UPI00118B3584|nr:hypothetical protein [Symmachiella dynata]QDT51659.1 hypothetical protein Pan258_57480 [Symmachiella dynata]